MLRIGVVRRTIHQGRRLGVFDLHPRLHRCPENGATIIPRKGAKAERRNEDTKYSPRCALVSLHPWVEFSYFLTYGRGCAVGSYG